MEEGEEVLVAVKRDIRMVLKKYRGILGRPSIGGAARAWGGGPYSMRLACIDTGSVLSILLETEKSEFAERTLGAHRESRFAISGVNEALIAPPDYLVYYLV